jgi:hypothetical protein
MIDRMDVDEMEVALAEYRSLVEQLTAQTERYRQEFMKRSADAEEEQKVIYDCLQQSFDWGK